MVRSPVEICLGTSPSQAAKSRPLVNTSPAPIAATIALEMIGPMPGTLINRSQPASWRAMASISLGIGEVIRLPLGVGANILRRHQPGIVAQCPKFATEMMRADAGFHADQARRHIG